MRTIEEIRPLVRTIFPEGIPIQYAQPLTFIDPEGPHYGFGRNRPNQLYKLRFRKRHRDDHRRKKMMTDEEKDRKRWPLPEVAREAGITEDEWVSIAKKSWSDHFCGGEDGVLATAIGSFKGRRTGIISGTNGRK